MADQERDHDTRQILGVYSGLCGGVYQFVLTDNRIRENDMKLQQAIEITETPCNDLESGAMQVFPTDEDRPVFYHLTDYVVSTAIGSSVILCPR